MPFTTAELNALVDYQATRITHVSLHTASPGTTGANEAAVTRQAITFPAASSGSSVGAQLTFTVPAGTFTHFSYWTAATGGTYRGGFNLDTSQSPGAGGQVKLTPTLGPATSA